MTKDSKAEGYKKLIFWVMSLDAKELLSFVTAQKRKRC